MKDKIDEEEESLVIEDALANRQYLDFLRYKELSFGLISILKEFAFQEKCDQGKDIDVLIQSARQFFSFVVSRLIDLKALEKIRNLEEQSLLVQHLLKLDWSSRGITWTKETWEDALSEEEASYLARYKNPVSKKKSMSVAEEAKSLLKERKKSRPIEGLPQEPLPSAHLYSDESVALLVAYLKEGKYDFDATSKMHAYLKSSFIDNLIGDLQEKKYEATDKLPDSQNANWSYEQEQAYKDIIATFLVSQCLKCLQIAVKEAHQANQKKKDEEQRKALERLVQSNGFPIEPEKKLSNGQPGSPRRLEGPVLSRKRRASSVGEVRVHSLSSFKPVIFSPISEVREPKFNQEEKVKLPDPLESSLPAITPSSTLSSEEDGPRHKQKKQQSIVRRLLNFTVLHFDFIQGLAITHLYCGFLVSCGLLGFLSIAPYIGFILLGVGLLLVLFLALLRIVDEKNFKVTMPPVVEEPKPDLGSRRASMQNPKKIEPLVIEPDFPKSQIMAHIKKLRKLLNKRGLLVIRKSSIPSEFDVIGPRLSSVSSSFFLSGDRTSGSKKRFSKNSYSDPEERGPRFDAYDLALPKAQHRLSITIPGHQSSPLGKSLMHALSKGREVQSNDLQSPHSEESYVVVSPPPLSLPPLTAP